jgi:hypothetical protein
MDENIITSIVRNRQMANFQQLMRGKGFVNNFSLHLCFFVSCKLHGLACLWWFSCFDGTRCLELFSIAGVSEQFLQNDLEDVSEGVQEVNTI